MLHLIKVDRWLREQDPGAMQCRKKQTLLAKNENTAGGPFHKIELVLTQNGGAISVIMAYHKPGEGPTTSISTRKAIV